MYSVLPDSNRFSFFNYLIVIPFRLMFNLLEDGREHLSLLGDD